MLKNKMTSNLPVRYTLSWLTMATAVFIANASDIVIVKKNKLLKTAEIVDAFCDIRRGDRCSLTSTGGKSSSDQEEGTRHEDTGIGNNTECKLPVDRV